MNNWLQATRNCLQIFTSISYDPTTGTVVHYTVYSKLLHCRWRRGVKGVKTTCPPHFFTLHTCHSEKLVFYPLPIVFNDILCIVWNEKCKLNCFVSSGPMCQYIYKVCRPANPWENFYCKDICESPGFECVKFVNILTKSTPVRASSYNPKPKFVNYVFIILSCLRRTL